jgi:hypothetical protein
MNNRFEFDLEAFGAQPFSFEEEEEIGRKGGGGTPPRRPAAARQAALRHKAPTKPWPPRPPWPRPVKIIPSWFPIGPLPYQAREDREYARWVQVSLNKALNLNLQTNGMMDAATRYAIRSFQRREGLPVTGVVGPDTERALVAATRGPAVASADGGDQEISWLSSVWPGLMEFETAVAAPSLIGQEQTPPGQTLYVNIPLGAEGPAKPMTGIFIPQRFRPKPKVDLIIYLHGIKPKLDLTVDRYWNRSHFPTWPLREGLNQSGKDFILVAPTLGPRSQTQTGWLAQPGGLDKYVDLVLAALATHGPYQGRRPQLGNLILACHSGGGLPMRQLAMGKNRCASQIKECWGFDCLYFTGDENLWAQWAKSRPDARLFIHYQSSTRERSEKLKQKNVPNISVSRSAAKGHNWVPIHHWQERLEASLQTRAAGVAAQPSREWEQELVPEWLSRRDWSSIALRSKAVALANKELNRWGRGTIKESDPRLRSVIEDYWRSGPGYKPGGPNWWSAVPWSAAFISWLMRKAGAGADFKYSGSHAAYTAAAKQNRLANNNIPFKAYRITEVDPRVGDLVCKSRAGSGATYDNITPGMATHCDIVTTVEPNRLITVGGNVSNSVKQTQVRTDASGHINQPGYFAVIKVGA